MKTRKYPEWVDKYRIKGTSVKKVGNKYYLYKATSKRVPGKKNPQPVETFIGVLDEEKGLIKSENRIINTSDIKVYEYGFSYVLYKLAYEKLIINSVSKKDKYSTFIKTVASISPNTYLLNEINKDEFEEIKVNTVLILKKIEETINIKLSCLESLKYIYLVKMGNNTFISDVSIENRELLKRIKVSI